jgi:hypothetical protein
LRGVHSVESGRIGRDEGDRLGVEPQIHNRRRSKIRAREDRGGEDGEKPPHITRDNTFPSYDGGMICL